jgi:two-component system, OmpR family, response regulator MprA
MDGGIMTTKILLIEDDPQYSEIIKHALVFEGYQVDLAEDGLSGLSHFAANAPDLVVLDWLLPGMDGLEVCRRIRNSSALPILMLTGKEATADRVNGLDAGADDYMVKPYQPEELLARIRALLRRTHMEQSPVLTFQDLALDTSTRQAMRKGRVIHLTAKEYDLLEIFIRHPKQVLTREVIFDRVWGYDFGGESNVLDVYIRYLRQKLETRGETRLIFTVRGIGYVLKDQD